MIHPRFPVLAVVIAHLALTWVPVVGQITLTQSDPSGIYDAGETATFTITPADGADQLQQVKARFRLHGATSGDNAGQAQPIDLSQGPVTLETTSSEPATTILEVTWKSPAGKDGKAALGAAFDPYRIAPTVPRPDDFDAFWKAQLQLLAAVPMNAQVLPVELAPATRPSDPDPARIDYAKVTLDNVDGTKVYGQIARPKNADGAKYPAVLLVQYAGVYGLPKTNVTDRAKSGWLALNIMAHDLPFDLPAEEYAAVSQQKLKGYAMIGRSSRETSYFRRMFLGCYRAAEFLTQQPDWNGQVLVVSGGSQGGLQAIATAGLHPKVTAVICNVPAGADTLQGRHGRLAGWPGWLFGLPNDPAERDAVLETSRYFDPVNFAPNVKVPTLIGMGLVDTTSTPSGPLALFNQLGGPKRLIVVPHADHMGTGNAYRPHWQVASQWWSALQKNQPVPLDNPAPTTQN